MAIQKKETTEKGQTTIYHKILKCEFDAKYRQIHIVVGSYADEKYRAEEKTEETEKEEQLLELQAFREQLAGEIQIIERKLSNMQERADKLRDKIDDIIQEPSLIDSEEIGQEKQERQEPLIQELEETVARMNELYEERESLLIQDAKAMESIQAWTARVSTERYMYLTTYTLAQAQSEAVNNMLDLIYPEIMKLDPFAGGKKI